MIGTFLKRIAQFISILALQVLVFNHVQIVGYATPMVCIYFILLFPLGTPHWQTLLWAFAIGLLQDIFSNTPGMNAASLTFVGFIQPMLLKTFSPKDVEDGEKQFPPSAKSLDWSHFIRYMSIAVILQQIFFYLLESFSFFNLQEMAINIAGGSLMSILIITAIEGVRIGGSKQNK